MKSLFIIVFLVLFATVISLNSCKKIFDSTGELIYYTSFEQDPIWMDGKVFHLRVLEMMLPNQVEIIPYLFPEAVNYQQQNIPLKQLGLNKSYPFLVMERILPPEELFSFALRTILTWKST